MAGRKTVSSSMVDLKAELYRKQDEFKNQKAASAGFIKSKGVEKVGKSSIWSQKNKGVSDRASKDLEEKSEDDQDEGALEKSRRALEEKAKLYDKISSAAVIPEEDGSGYFLVDFQKKAIDSIVSEREAERQRDEEKEREAERVSLMEELPEPSTPDEEWMDFTDSLGRSRRCLRKDLDHLMGQDKLLAMKELKKKTGLLAGHKVQSSLVSEDEHMEKMRQKWEAEAEELGSQGHGQVHYSNVQFDEIRSHGVGFYQFSKDHETREEQLERLKKLREETVGEKSRKDRIKDKRKNMMEARLAKVRQRRGLKGTLTPPETVKEEPSSSVPDSTDNISQEELKKKKEVEEAAEDKRKAHVRDWDKGKHTSLEKMHQNYVENQRQVREEEFAPPSVYFQDLAAKKTRSKPVMKAAVSDRDRIEHLQGLTKQHAGSSQFHSNTEILQETKHSKNHRKVCDAIGQSQSSAVLSQDAMDTGAHEIDLSSVPLPGNINTSALKSHVTAAPELSTVHTNFHHEILTQQQPFSQRTSQFCSDQPFFPEVASQANFSHPQEASSPLCQQVLENEQCSSLPANHTPSPVQHPPFPSYSAGTYSPADQPPVWNNQTCAYDNYTSIPPPMQNQPASQYHQTSSQHPATQYPPMSHCQTSTSNQYQSSNQFLTTGQYPPPTVQGFQNHVQVPQNGQQSSSTSAEIAPASHQNSTGDLSKRKASTDVSEEPARKKIVPKMAIMDTRYMQNEISEPSFEDSVEGPVDVAPIVYTPGSFTAAKDASRELYEQEVLQSQHMDQISGGACLYTAQELEEQQHRKASEEAEEKVQDFLNSLKTS